MTIFRGSGDDAESPGLSIGGQTNQIGVDLAVFWIIFGTGSFVNCVGGGFRGCCLGGFPALLGLGFGDRLGMGLGRPKPLQFDRYAFPKLAGSTP